MSYCKNWLLTFDTAAEYDDFIKKEKFKEMLTATRPP